MSASPPPFSLPTRVYWEDTDAGGVVYHAQYLAFLERARTEALRSLGLGQENLRATHDVVFVVRDMQLDFLKPAKLDDLLDVRVQLQECRKASLVFAQSIVRDDVLLLTATVRVAAVKASAFSPVAIPAALHQQLKSLETGD
ncbi:MAG: tol-pal system-associated acyl-CoA thioesterase [Pseudoxanthomonas sp.]